ncbi:MAG TPA: DUF2188 domain-containing protein [Chthonomonadales bacterium]|nr:DUF2188 domain-containing protein [Chthonomonadales bacterium]
MAKQNVHVIPHGQQWAIKKAGGQRATAIVPTQKEAMERARDIARKEQSELIVHGRNGCIRSKDSFGNDPNPPRDREH